MIWYDIIWYDMILYYSHMHPCVRNGQQMHRDVVLCTTFVQQMMIFNLSCTSSRCVPIEQALVQENGSVPSTSHLLGWVIFHRDLANWIQYLCYNVTQFFVDWHFTSRDRAVVWSPWDPSTPDRIEPHVYGSICRFDAWNVFI